MTPETRYHWAAHYYARRVVAGMLSRQEATRRLTRFQPDTGIRPAPAADVLIRAAIAWETRGGPWR